MIILITGGASGLGEAITKNLAADAANQVYFTYSRSAGNAAKIEAEFPNTVSVKCDFSNAAEVAALTEKISQWNLDVLINNAYSGSFIKSYFHKTTSEEFLTEFAGNIIPTIAVTQAAINSFRKKKSGKIITILTAALINTPPIGSSIYVANKAYLEELTKVWATENVKFNITSNAVSPAFMQTRFTEQMDERLIEQIIDSHPLKKLLTTTEVAETISFLVHAPQQMNGVNIILNAAANIN